MNSRPARTNATLFGSALAAIALFLLAAHNQPSSTNRIIVLDDNQLVISAPLQIVMYAGDRFLAADLEAIRVAAIGPSEEAGLADFRRRAQTAVSQLNPCHEDNFFLANAMLTWGGAVEAGNNILERATECRYWDDIPPFFLGFNRYFFSRDLDGAQEALKKAANRSEKNRIPLQQLSIVMASKKFDDVKMAVNYLRSERDQAKDPRLVEMLNRRLKRLEGLITLREAQTRYEKKYKHPLKHPDDLITAGILTTFPDDPMRLGYEFDDGHFRLRAAKIGGMEIRQ